MKRIKTFSSEDDYRKVKVTLEYFADASDSTLKEKERDCDEIIDKVFLALTDKFYSFRIKMKP